MTAPIQNFSVPRNNDVIITVPVATTVIDDTLVGCSIKWALYSQQYGIPQDGVAALITKTTSGHGITIPASPPNLMEFDVALAKADTLPLEYGNYYYEGTVTDAFGNVVSVVCGIVAITIAEN